MSNERLQGTSNLGRFTPVTTARKGGPRTGGRKSLIPGVVYSCQTKNTKGSVMYRFMFNTNLGQVLYDMGAQALQLMLDAEGGRVAFIPIRNGETNTDAVKITYRMHDLFPNRVVSVSTSTGSQEVRDVLNVTVNTFYPVTIVGPDEHGLHYFIIDTKTAESRPVKTRTASGAAQTAQAVPASSSSNLPATGSRMSKAAQAIAGGDPMIVKTKSNNGKNKTKEVSLTV